MNYETLKIEREQGVAIITINRPEKRNALNSVVRAELKAVIAGLSADDDVRVLVLTGAGEKAFVAGADIAEFAERTPLEQRRAMEQPRVFEVLAQCP